MAIRAVLADDHGVIRDGLRMILESRDEISVVGVAENGHEAVELARRLKPEVAIMDITMPKLNGIEATRKICESIPGIKVIVLSMHAGAENVFRAIEAGAAGYVLKESAGKEVIDAIQCVMEGNHYLSPRITSVVIDNYMRDRASADVRGPLNLLSPREREVLQLVVEGKTSKEIARLVNISSKTVDTYRYRIMQKLDVPDLAGLIRFALENGITPPY